MSSKTAKAVKSNASANKAEQEAYDEVPYQSHAYAQTHPSHISTIATLFGLTPPDFKTARVLELGCAAGGNILPLALAYPKGHFVGIDISPEQIRQANVHKKALNLSNVEFTADDILTFDLKANKEKFDYIICHGIFSWVPEPVRKQILKLCSACLSPDGLVLISYNTLPGWNAVRSLREMMLYHSNRFSNPAEKVQQSRALLDFLADNVTDQNAGYRTLIDFERQMLKNLDDSYLFHDHLESVNAQFYFHDFVHQSAAEGLQYVGDSNFITMFAGNMPAKAMEVLKAIDDVVNQEQYMDFLNNRRFRSSILAKNVKKLSRDLKPEQVLDYYLMADFTTDQKDPSRLMTYKTQNGGSFSTNDVTTGTLFLELIACGRRPIAAKELIARVQKKLNLPDPKPVQDMLFNNALNLILRGFISIFSESPDFVTEISKKPVAYPLARYQAGLKNCQLVGNALRQLVRTDPLANVILSQLDGTKTVDDVIDILLKDVETGKLNISKENVPVKDVAIIRAELAKVVNTLLPKLAEQGVLVG